MLNQVAEGVLIHQSELLGNNAVVVRPAHARGNAALLIEGRRVLAAGDMLSDILIPFPDLDAADPIEDYLAGLRGLEGVADEVDVLIPGHGDVCGQDQLRARIEQDRAYGSPAVSRSTLRRPFAWSDDP